MALAQAATQHNTNTKTKLPPKVWHTTVSNKFDFNSDLSYSNTINLTRGETKFGITSLSPVPATNTLTIAFNTVTNNTVKVSVYDAIGKLITAEQVVAGATTHTLNVNNYASGMYFMTLTDGTTTVTTKFVKQ